MRHQKRIYREDVLAIFVLISKKFMIELGLLDVNAKYNIHFCVDELYYYSYILYTFEHFFMYSNVVHLTLREYFKNYSIGPYRDLNTQDELSNM